jgi:hypothetical protein
VRSLVVHGGWADVDRAWGRPSLTTEQVLHPDKFWSSEPGLTVPTPSFASLGTVSEVWTDVRGELGLILVLASAVPRAAAADAARGWGGDVVAVARTPTVEVLAWRIRYDDEASASRAEGTLETAFAASACSVTRTHADVLVVVGLPHDRCTRLANEIIANAGAR